MIIRRVAAIALVLCVGLFSVSCGGPIYTFRYRLAIEVETPDGPKSGASVIETNIQDNRESWGPHEARLITSRVKGDAVFVDLGQGRHIVGLLAFGAFANADTDFTRIPYRTFQLRDVKEIASWPERKGRYSLPLDLIPTLVTFGDPNRSSTAKVISPEDLSKEFGEGFRFTGAWIEMTTDAVTRGIEQRLPWITRAKHDGLSGRIYGQPGRFIPNVPYFTRD